jgi:chromate transport protein ChrA
MDELELLKKDWEKSTKKYPNLSKEDIYGVISKRSSSIVKWIFIISILEFILWTALSFFGDSNQVLEKIQAYDYGFIYYAVFVISYIVIFVFMYLFYNNYRNIAVTENTKVLMEQILKTRKTVKQYVIYNLSMMVLSILMGVMMELSNNNIESKGDNNLFIFYLIIIILSIITIVVVVALFLGFYYLIYGLLLKRLKKNYKELKTIADLD